MKGSASCTETYEESRWSERFPLQIDLDNVDTATPLSLSVYHHPTSLVFAQMNTATKYTKQSDAKVIVPVRANSVTWITVDLDYHPLKGRICRY